MKRFALVTLFTVATLPAWAQKLGEPVPLEHLVPNWRPVHVQVDRGRAAACRSLGVYLEIAATKYLAGDAKNPPLRTFELVFPLIDKHCMTKARK